MVCARRLGDLDDYTERPEVPLVLTVGGVVHIVIARKFPHDGRFAILLIADLAALDFEKEMIGILAVSIRVRNRKVGIGMNNPLQIRLLPARLKHVVRTKLFQGYMELGDVELVVKRPLGMVVERFAPVGLHAFAGKAIGVGSTPSRLLEIEIGDTVNVPGLIEEA
jgi:hypothetical protein